MGKTRKTYSESFKKQVAIEALDRKKTVAEIAASNNITPGMVSTWKNAFINGEFSKDLKKAQKENEKLKKQLEAKTLALGKAQLMLELIKKKDESQGVNPFELVDEESAEKSLLGSAGLSISEQCRILEVSRSGYYNWKNKKNIEDICDTEAKKEEIER